MRRAAIVAVSIISAVLFVTSVLSANYPAVPSNTWAAASSLTTARLGATATLLSDGRVLVAGGFDGAGNPVSSVEIYNTDGSVSAGPPMNVARANHAAIALIDDDILVTGGISIADGSATNSAELFDVVHNTWTQLPAMAQARAGHTVSQLLTGDVLLAGGTNSSGPVALLETFDETTNSFAAAGTLVTPRANHAAAVLNDGRVMIIGGSTVAADGSTQTLASTEIFDPSAGTVAAGPSLITARSGHSATTALDGRVIVIGGTNPALATIGAAAELASVEIFDPTATTPAFTQSASQLATARTGHLAFLLPNNSNVLIIGGTAAGAELSSAELYTPWTDTFQPAGSMAAARASAAGTPMMYRTGTGIDGLLLVVGGKNASDGTLASGDLYGFATVKTDKTDYAPGTTVTITGSGWKPGETVNLTFRELPNIDTPGPYTVTADGNGNIVDSEFAPDVLDVNVRFYLTAVGQTSALQAQNTFTDDNVNPPTNITTTNLSIGSILINWTNQTGSGHLTAIDRKFLPPGGTCTPEDNSIAVPNSGYSRIAAVPVSGNNPSTDSFTDTIPSQNQVVGEVVCYTLYVLNKSGNFSLKEPLVQTTAFVDTPPVAVNDSYTVNANTTLTVAAPGVLGNDTGGLGPVFQAVQVTDSTKVLVIDSGPSHDSSFTLNSNGSFTYTPTSGFTGTDTFTYHAYDGFAYSDNPATVTITVSALPLTITANDQTVTYGGTMPTLTYTVNPNVTLDTTPTCTSSHNTSDNVGTYTGAITCSGAAKAGYNISYVAGTLTVNPATATVTITPYSVNYDSLPHTASYTITGVNGETGATVGTVTLTSTHTAAGTYSNDTYSFTPAANYSSTLSAASSASPFTDTINKAPTTTLVVSSKNPSSYGDPVTFTATVSNPNTPTDTPTGSVSFYDAVSGATCTSPAASKQIGTPQTLNSGTASVPTGFPNYDLLVGNHTILACYAGDSNHIGSSGTVTQTVNAGIGTVAYIGQTLFMTSGSSSTTVQATLSASVLASAGSLANAKVTFTDLITGAVLAKGVPVSQVSGSSYQTGTANTIVTLSTGKYGSNEYLIQVKLDATLGSFTNVAPNLVASCPTSAGPYQIVQDSTGTYCDTTNTAFATLSVVIPPTTNSMQGDAAIGLTTDAATLPVSPAGTLVGNTSYTVLKKVHNTIGLTYNKGGTNPQGQIQLVLERPDGTYYVKSNSIVSMACSNIANNPCKDLTVYTKASIYKIAANGVLTSIDGNVSLRMDAHDTDPKTPAAYDTIGFTVLSSKDGSLYYSNNWIYDSNAKGWRTVPQAVATGTTPNLAVSIN